MVKDTDIVTIIHWPLLFGAPFGGDTFGISPNFWHQKARVPGLSYGVVCVISGLAILVEHRLVMDRQTDERHMTTASTVERVVMAIGCPDEDVNGTFSVNGGN